MTDDVWPRCWRICHRCPFPVEMLGAPAKTRGSSESERETHYSPGARMEGCVPSLEGIREKIQSGRDKTCAFSKRFQEEISTERREDACEPRCTWADNRVLFSRCRCEYSHQWTLSICAHAGTPQLMESVAEAALCFLSETEETSHVWIAIWKSAAAVLSAQTSRWHEGCAQRCKLAGRSVRRVCSGVPDDTRPRTFHFSVSDGRFSTRLDALEMPPWLRVQMCRTELKQLLTYSNIRRRHRSGTDTNRVFCEYFSPPFSLSARSWNTSAERLRIPLISHSRPRARYVRLDLCGSSQIRLEIQ